MTDLQNIARERAKYVQDVLDVREKLARAFAYRELGFSHSGLAEKLDVTEGTAKKYVRNLDDMEETPDMYNLITVTEDELQTDRNLEDIEVYVNQRH